jgi:hypothetical protein
MKVVKMRVGVHCSGRYSKFPSESGTLQRNIMAHSVLLANHSCTISIIPNGRLHEMTKSRLWAVFVYHGVDENDVMTAMRFARIQGMEPHLISLEKKPDFHHHRVFSKHDGLFSFGDDDASEDIQKYMIKRAPNIYVQEYFADRITQAPIICLNNGILVFADFWFGPGDRRYANGIVVGGDFAGIKRRNPDVLDSIKQLFEGRVAFPDEESLD